MATPVANLVIATNTWNDLINTLNTLCTLASNFLVTANNLANGSVTTGNGFVNGIFGANTLVATTLRSGNVQSNGTVLTIFSPITVGNTRHTDLSVATTNTSAQIIDSYAIANNRVAKFMIQITCPTIGWQGTELMAIHDGTTASLTEYATLVTNTSLATSSANVQRGNLNLIFTPTNANNTVNIYRMAMAV